MNESRSVLWVLTTAAMLLAQPAVAQDVEASADVEQPSMWRWAPAGPADYAVIGASAATIATARALGPARGRFGGQGILADEAVRDALLLPTREGQHVIADVSDLTLSLVTAWPMLDATVVSFGHYRDAELARELAILSFEVSGVVAAMQTLANSIAGRQRPFGRRCGSELPETLDDCFSRDRHYSFFSGHTSQSFAAAAVTCSVHAKLDLYGGGAADWLPCIGTMSLAAFTGAARIMADKHYLSDVVTGAVVGTTVGLVIPLMVRFRPQRKSRVQIFPTGNGVQVGGVF